MDDFIFNRLWAGSLLHGDDTWRTTVVRDDLYAEYLKDATRMGIGRKRSNADFGKRLKKLISGIGETKVTVEGEHCVARRAYAHVMPALDECRVAFDRYVSQPIDWPALPLGESERAHCDLTDSAPV